MSGGEVLQPRALRWADMVLVGRVGRTHGLRGQAFVNPDTDFPEARFQPGAVVYIEGSDGPEALRIATFRMQRDRPIVGFEGMDSIDQVEGLAGKELRIPPEWLELLPADSYYVHDLVGCRVETTDGTGLGIVERVEGEGEAARLVVMSGRGEVMVPLVADICRAVDIAGKQILVEPPEGLIDLNVTQPRAESRRSRHSRRPRPRRVGPRGSR